jgi:hypothetical protein
MGGALTLLAAVNLPEAGCLRGLVSTAMAVEEVISPSTAALRPRQLLRAKTSA